MKKVFEGLTKLSAIYDKNFTTAFVLLRPRNLYTNE